MMSVNLKKVLTNKKKVSKQTVKNRGHYQFLQVKGEKNVPPHFSMLSKTLAQLTTRYS